MTAMVESTPSSTEPEEDNRIAYVEPTMMELIKSWNHSDQHAHRYECPVCGGNTNIAITKIVYTFEVCRCDAAEYDHLVEVLYHRACLAKTTCETFHRPQRRRNGFLPAAPDECRGCGRPESAH